VILIGVGLAISRPVRQALIANTVPREDFGNAFATNTFTIADTHTRAATHTDFNSYTHACSHSRSYADT